MDARERRWILTDKDLADRNFPGFRTEPGRNGHSRSKSRFSERVSPRGPIRTRFSWQLAASLLLALGFASLQQVEGWGALLQEQIRYAVSLDYGSGSGATDEAPDTVVPAVSLSEIPDEGERSFLWPARGTLLSSGTMDGEAVPYQLRLGLSEGEAVTASAAGWVVRVEHLDGQGFRVVMDHGQGWQSAYAGLQAVVVTPGQFVPAENRLGTVGLLLEEDMAVLEFTLMYQGKAVDPIHWLSRPTLPQQPSLQ